MTSHRHFFDGIAVGERGPRRRGSWYLAVALERAGEPARARAELEGLCRQQSPYASRACDAVPKLTSK